MLIAAIKLIMLSVVRLNAVILSVVPTYPGLVYSKLLKTAEVGDIVDLAERHDVELAILVPQLQ